MAKARLALDITDELAIRERRNEELKAQAREAANALNRKRRR